MLPHAFCGEFLFEGFDFVDGDDGVFEPLGETGHDAGVLFGSAHRREVLGIGDEERRRFERRHAGAPLRAGGGVGSFVPGEAAVARHTVQLWKEAGPKSRVIRWSPMRSGARDGATKASPRRFAAALAGRASRCDTGWCSARVEARSPGERRSGACGGAVLRRTK